MSWIACGLLVCRSQVPTAVHFKTIKLCLLFCICQVSKKNVSKEVCSQIHEKVAPFIKWLKEAEEEESSEEEEEEEVEVVYDTKAQQLKAHVDSTAAHEEDDDLDIDAI